jgi:hypothetical protein
MPANKPEKSPGLRTRRAAVYFFPTTWTPVVAMKRFRIEAGSIATLTGV